MRGYLFSFIILVIKSVSRIGGISSYVGYEIVMSLVYSTILTVVIPDIVHHLFHKTAGVLQILVFSFCALYFWQGYFFYPLTDLSAFFFVLVGINIISRFKKYWWTGIFSGLLWGGSALLRPSYQISLIPQLIWVWYFYRNEIDLHTKQVAARILVVTTGLIIVFSPQISINQYNHGTLSPFVQTQNHSKGTDLFSKQLGVGFDLQKYETNIGSNYPIAQVRFLDPHGESILIQSSNKAFPYIESGKLGPDFPLSVTEYIKLIGKYPLDFLVLYARHFLMVWI